MISNIIIAFTIIILVRGFVQTPKPIRPERTVWKSLESLKFTVCLSDKQQLQHIMIIDVRLCLLRLLLLRVLGKALVYIILFDEL